MVQGAMHESLNLASLWKLPCIYVIENNQWGMGTAVSRAVSLDPIGESLGKPYKIKVYTVDGSDFFKCFALFAEVLREVLQEGHPVLIEAVTERFRGHSISDPGLYRTKEQLALTMQQKDPLFLFKEELIKQGLLTEDEFKELDREQKEIVLAAMKFADESPWPDPITLEEGVFAPENK